MLPVFQTSGMHPGQARLEVDLVSGQSTVTTAMASSPLRLLTPCSRGQSVWAYTSSFGGGHVAGDQTRLDLRIGSGTRCFVSTQAATKVYRNPGLLPCGHSGRAEVEPNAVLVYAPDPVQAFAASSFTQRQEWHLEEDAGLALLDWFCSGRAARGERWQFARYQSRNDVFVEGELVCRDSISLEPLGSDVAAPHRAGRFDAFAMLLLIGKPLEPLAGELLQELAGRSVERRASLVCSASPVHHGALLRVAGAGVEEVARELQRQLQPLCRLLGDDPWRRKW